MREFAMVAFHLRTRNLPVACASPASSPAARRRSARSFSSFARPPFGERFL